MQRHLAAVDPLEIRVQGRGDIPDGTGRHAWGLGVDELRRGPGVSCVEHFERVARDVREDPERGFLSGFSDALEAVLTVDGVALGVEGHALMRQLPLTAPDGLDPARNPGGGEGAGAVAGAG